MWEASSLEAPTRSRYSLTAALASSKRSPSVSSFPESVAAKCLEILRWFWKGNSENGGGRRWRWRFGRVLAGGFKEMGLRETESCTEKERNKTRNSGGGGRSEPP
ncbi:hypothetical protein Salat_1470900 [Sesamum alatum]|uniref:Uncharacterized protein n=1 Tax=Sesamum alatum TaxID=300844 RepID=A0AAE1YBG8_9LAMI|nr:hypothetical protein Salat_1470900 [Sesamum alatum]